MSGMVHLPWRGRDIYLLVKDGCLMRHNLTVTVIALLAALAMPAISGQNLSAQNSSSAQYFSDQGDRYFLSGDFNNAVLSYDRALELEPNSTELWNNRGKALANLGDIDEAISCFDKSLSIDSANLEALNLKATALSQGQKRYDEAIVIYDQILQMDPNYFDAWIGKGMALANQGNIYSSLQCFNKATEVKPEDPAGWNNKGVVLREMGRYQDALTCFNKALTLDMSYETARLNREYTLQDMDGGSAGSTSSPSQSTTSML